MARPRSWSVLVATDATREARGAVAATASFPWPAGTRLSGVIVRTFVPRGRPPSFMKAFERVYARSAAAAQRVLARRHRGAEVAVGSGTPIDGILAAARGARVRVIVMGSRARSALARVLLGSVARGVVRRATCAVLVVRGRPREFTRLVIGVDGSVDSRRAIELVAGLPPPRGGRVILVGAVETLRAPVLVTGPPGAREAVAEVLAAENARRMRVTARRLARATRRLARAGWTVQEHLRRGEPLAELLAMARAEKAQLIAIGARGVGGTERVPLGSVADGLLNQSPVSVLVAR